MVTNPVLKRLAHAAAAVALLSVGVVLSTPQAAQAQGGDTAKADRVMVSPQVAIPVPAEPCYSQTGFLGGYGYVNCARTRVGACDTVADGLGVTVWYGTDNGTGGNVGDANGKPLPCGEEGPDHGGRITHFHVCIGTVCREEKWIP
jgi:hypothetical protein